MEDALNRFQYRIKVNEQTGCWEWQGCKTKFGYGQMRVNGRLSSPHIYAYQHHKGEIPAGYEVDHLCNNRGCANPDHLEAVTVQENRIRRDQRRTHCKRGHEFPPYEAGISRKCKICIKAYHKEWISSNYEHYAAYQREYNHTRRGLTSNIT